jgi:hypothetical protein
MAYLARSSDRNRGYRCCLEGGWASATTQS